jgi:hypothetical protein
MYTFANFTFLNPRDFGSTAEVLFAQAALLGIEVHRFGDTGLRLVGTEGTDHRISEFVRLLLQYKYDPSQQADTDDDI